MAHANRYCRRSWTFSFVGPDQAEVENFAEERYMVNARLCSKLADHVQFKDKDPRNKRDNKLINGSRIHFSGPNSPARLCSKPKRNLYFTEVGRYKESAGKEGSPVKIAKKRSATFRDVRFHFHESSPGIAGECEITELFELGSQEYYHVPCPHCNELQKLEFHNLKYKTEVIDGVKKYVKGSAFYECDFCKEKITNTQKNRAVAKRGISKWIAKYPERVEHRSFHINAFYSPWIPLSEIAEQWVNAQGDIEALKVFVNTYLAEAWEEKGEITSDHKIYQRREFYDATKELPEKVAYITCAVDTQDDWFDIEFKGWGRGYESWSLESIQIYGDNSIMEGSPSEPSLWEDLTKIIESRVYNHPSGTKLKVGAVAIDTGGHRTTQVYKWAIMPHRFNVYAIKGHNKSGAPLWSARPTRNNSQNCPLWMVGSDAGKNIFFADLQKEEYGPGYCHFPNYELEFFKQLTAEQRVKRKVNGVMITKWEPIRKRNEKLDLHVYGRALIEGLNKDLDALSDALGIPKNTGEKPDAIIARRSQKPKRTSSKKYRRRR